MLADDLDHEAEERVEQVDDLLRRARRGELGGADDVGEQDRHLAPLAAELDLLLERGPGDVLADVAAEQILDPLALAKPGDHAVEAGLQLADLAAVVDGHLDLELAALNRLDPLAQGDQRIGHRAGGEQREIEADREPEPAEREHHDRELVAAEVLLGQGRERDQDQPEERAPPCPAPRP